MISSGSMRWRCVVVMFALLLDFVLQSVGVCVGGWRGRRAGSMEFVFRGMGRGCESRIWSEKVVDD